MKIRYKLPLTDSDKENIAQLQALAKEEIESDKEKDQNRAEIVALRERLTGEVDSLKSLFNRNHKKDDVLKELTFKKSQLAALEAEIDGHGRDEKGRRPVPRDNYHALMIQANECLTPFLNICLQELCEEVTAVIRPFYQYDNHARDIASQTWLVNSFGNFKSNLVTISAPKASVIRQLVILENLLAGEALWTFDPKMKDQAGS